MKLSIGILVIALSAVLVPAQQTTVAVPAARADEAKARVVAELAGAGRVLGGIKNMPFSADEINESVQTLADGNRIVRSTTGKIYRNSEGLTRRDLAGGTGGVLSSTYSIGSGVSMITPRADAAYLVDAERKTAVEMEQARKLLAIAGGMTAQSAAANDRMREELRAAAPAIAAVPPVPPVPVIVEGQGGVFAVSSTQGTSSKYETTTEQLGVRDFEGVSAEGTRRTTIIPAGAIGNDRPIEIVYERWYSKELGMVVYSRNSDPRFGEQTYRMTNIIRAEPDPSLFAVPQHYKKVSGGGTLYRATPKPAVKATATGTVQKKIKPQYFN